MTDLLVHSDCMAFMPTLTDKSIDMTLTDIPYGVCNVERRMDGHGESDCLRMVNKSGADDVTFDLDKFLSNVIRITKGSIYIFCSTEQVSEIRSRFDAEEMTTRVIVWEKTNPSPMNGQYVWLSGIELCVFAKFKGATFNGFCKNTVLRYPCGTSKQHPTQKPLDMFCELIKISSNENDVVFDPCVGSGTTAVAAMKTGRHFIGCEIDDKYFQLANRRFVNAKNSGFQMELI